MAVGRRDYTWGFLNESATEGRYSESFFEYISQSLDAGTGSNLYSYTIPSGYRVGLNKVFCSTNCRGILYVAISKNGAEKVRFFFSDLGDFTVSDKNPLYFDAGDVLLVYVYNYDEVTADVHLSVIGVKESI